MPAGMAMKKKKKGFKVDLQRKSISQHCKWEYIRFFYMYFQRRRGESVLLESVYSDLYLGFFQLHVPIFLTK